MCDACHTTNAWTPVITPFAHNETTAQCSFCHNNNIAAGKSGGHPQSTNQCDGCHTTSGWRNFLVPIDHTQTQALCSQCHNGAVASGKTPNHITTTAQCDVCHLITSWLPASFDHATVAGQACAAAGCHDGVSPRTFKPGNHPLTSNVCEACHRTTSWLPLITPFAHEETSAQCVTCHNGAIAAGKSGGHPQSTNNCDGCHIAGAGWGSFLQPIDHSQTQAACTRCHGSVAQGKPGNHPITTNACEACHSPNQWLPVLRPFDHSEADTTTCETSGCHSLPGGHCNITAPLGSECSQCHTTNGWASAQTCNLSPNGAPTAVINGPTSAGIGDTLTFDGRSSFDPDNDPLTYSWTIEGQNYSSAQVSHTFNNAGNVTVRLVVNDGQSNSQADQLTVNVSTQPPANQAPTARINGPNSANQGDRLTFDGGGSSDPDGSISSYSWTIEGQNYNGISASHTFNNPGNVQVRLVVTDNSGANSSPATQNVNVTAQVNRPPTVTINGPTSGCVNQALSYTSNAQDPDNDTLRYQWRVTPPGSASFSTPQRANTTITFTSAGNRTANLEVTDTAQNTASDSISVNIQSGMMCGMGGMGGGM